MAMAAGSCRQQGRTTVTCIEYDLSEEEALHWLLQRHQRVECLNTFSRILLALDLEPWLQEKARTHQKRERRHEKGFIKSDRS